MPILNITTNVPGNAVDNSDALKAFSKAVTDGVGKPEQYVTVSLKTDMPMIFGGTEEPTAYGELLSIGAIGGDKNKQITKLVADILTSKFGVPSDRFYLTFHDMARTDVGWKGSTFG